MYSRLVALRIRPAGRGIRQATEGPELPECWLLAEWPADQSAPVQFWLSDLPADTPLTTLVRLAKLRWRIEHDYRQMKQALGLAHFEGRTWPAGTTTSPSSPSPTPSAPCNDWPKPQKTRRRPEPLPSRPRAADSPRDLGRRLPHMPPRHTHPNTNLTKHYELAQPASQHPAFVVRQLHQQRLRTRHRPLLQPLANFQLRTLGRGGGYELQRPGPCVEPADLDVAGQFGSDVGPAVGQGSAGRRGLPAAGFHERRVFWVVDNGASHRNWAAAALLSDAYPNAQMVHLPVHASWLNQVEVYFSVIRRRLLTPDDFEDLDELAAQILAFENHYNAVAGPFDWKFTRADLNQLLVRIRRHDRHAPQPMAA
jgi:hypothetical protein